MKKYMSLAENLIFATALLIYPFARAETNGVTVFDVPLFSGEEWGPRQDEIAQSITQTSIETAKANADARTVHRDAHPKHHGCVKAEWKTGDITPQIGKKAGLFSQVGATYPAWIRFSNGSPTGAAGDDGDADVRGMAVKLMGVSGTPKGSQDFVMMTSKKFFSKDAEDYLSFHEAFTGGTFSLLGYLATHPRNALVINSARIHADSPLALTYSSPVPSRLGDKSMRFRVEPCAQLPKFKSSKNPNYLREVLVKTLAKQDACFDFYVQPNQDPENNPVEDPRLAWDESVSPFLRAGRLTISQQTGIDSEEQLAFCENISFNPWNTKAENRPLGQINRIRKVVYDGVSAYRHRANGVGSAEPVNFTPCATAASASLCDTH